RSNCCVGWMANPYLKKYPTPWQRKTMWASLTAVFVVTLVGIVGTVIWLAGNLVGFLQPILMPVAIALILAYLLDPLVIFGGAGLRPHEGNWRALHDRVLRSGGGADMDRAVDFDAERQRRQRTAGIHRSRPRQGGRSNLSL
ncbi:MAG TPA: hypothetical protein VGP40_01840, partial [Chthoniobacterales bacterium]|nr:hypothetical protein [Chthoniobacterales bacterium]